jgi:exonuclease SbcD
MGELDRTGEHRFFLEFLLKALRENAADALIIAGDVFDSATPPQTAVRLYFEFLARAYSELAIPAVVVSGNHDSPGHLESPREALRVLNVILGTAFPADPQHALHPLPSAQDAQVVVAAIPFLRERDLRSGYLGQSEEEIRRELQEGICARYREVGEAAQCWAERGVPVIATGHLTAIGCSVSDSEREIHVGGLGSVGADAFPPIFQYVALGHLHKPQAVGGREHVRYSGSPIALSFSEAGDRKEIRVLDFVGNGLVGNHSIPIPPGRRLYQIEATRAELEKVLSEFTPEDAHYKAWVEVTITDADAREDLYKAVLTAAEGRPFDVIRVQQQRSATAGLMLDSEWDDAAADHLLSDPAAVFAKRLEAAQSLSEEDRTILKTAFAELHTMLLDQQRNEPSAPACQ